MQSACTRVSRHLAEALTTPPLHWHAFTAEGRRSHDLTAAGRRQDGGSSRKIIVQQRLSSELGRVRVRRPSQTQRPDTQRRMPACDRTNQAVGITGCTCTDMQIQRRKSAYLRIFLMRIGVHSGQNTVAVLAGNKRRTSFARRGYVRADDWLRRQPQAAARATKAVSTGREAGYGLKSDAQPAVCCCTRPCPANLRWRMSRQYIKDNVPIV